MFLFFGGRGRIAVASQRTGTGGICTNSFIIGIALLFHRPSEKPLPNMPSQKPINESHRAQRASPFRNQHPFCNPLCRLTHVVLLQKRFALCLAPRRMRAAFFAYFFLLLKKSRSPKASKATHDAVGPNALEKRATSVQMGADQHFASFNLRSIWLVQMARGSVPTADGGKGRWD